MVKNALQAQLLKAGLVDNKKAKKLSKQEVHEQRTGQSNEAEIKAKIAQDQEQKQARDHAIEQEKKAALRFAFRPDSNTSGNQPPFDQQNTAEHKHCHSSRWSV